MAIELKVDRFEPEHLGKLNFYLEALDRDVRKPHENPAIGLLLCALKDSEVVEYALSRTLSPALVAQYQTQLPDKQLLADKLHEFYALNAPDPGPEPAAPPVAAATRAPGRPQEPPRAPALTPLSCHAITRSATAAVPPRQRCRRPLARPPRRIGASAHAWRGMLGLSCGRAPPDPRLPWPTCPCPNP